DTYIAAKAVTNAVPELGVAGQRPGIGLYGSRAGENRIARRKAAITGHVAVREAHVIVERASEIQRGRAVAHDPSRVPNGRRESSLDRSVAEDVVSGAGPRGLRVAQEPQQRVPEREPDVVVQPAHHADAHTLDREVWIERAARAADPELILGNELGRLAQVDAQRVLPDAEHDGVGRRRRLL